LRSSSKCVPECKKMMGAMQGKESPYMDELMESIKAEEQVKGASGADPNSCLGAYICLLSQKAFATMSFRVLPILEGAGGSMAT